MKLYLDGTRNPPEGWMVVRSYESFVKMIQSDGVPEVVSFDHDLGEDLARELVDSGVSKRKARATKKDIKNGLDCARYLLEYCRTNKIPFPEYYVHSQNPVGRENIFNLIEFYIMKGKVIYSIWGSDF